MLRLFSKKSDKAEIVPARWEKLKKICQILQIKVKDYKLLDQALTHSSYFDKSSSHHETYERLEFLGDSILNASAAYLLYMNNERLTEGALSALRSSLVDEKTLSQLAFSLNILDYVNLGKGETLSDRRAKEKVAADILESIIAVLFLENGFKNAQDFVKRLLKKEILNRLKMGTRDFKTQLQKWAISKYKEYPHYQVTNESGPDHNKVFEVKVSVHNEYFATASGRTKKEAEQNAAEKIMKEIKDVSDEAPSKKGAKNA
jgi:ribonuclease-3